MTPAPAASGSTTGNPSGGAETGNGTGTSAASTTTATSGVTLSTSGATGTTQAAATGNDPWSGLAQEHRAVVDGKGWKTPEDVVKSYRELETRFSQTRAVDGPKAATDYDAVLTKPQNAKDIGYNDDFAKWFKDTAFKAKIPVEAAKHIHDEFLSWAGSSMASANEAQSNAMNARIEKTGQDLVAKWGSPNTPQFTRNVEMMRRTMDHLEPGLKDALFELGALVKVGDQEMVANATVAKALAKIGAEKYAEDELFGNAAEQSNPFDPATLDLTAQGNVWKQDKAKAKAMIMSLKPEHRARYEYLVGKT